MHCQAIFISILSLILAVNGIQSDSSGRYIVEQLPSEDSSKIVTTYRKDPSLQSIVTTVVIEKAASNICQIRVYFTTFHVGEADEDGFCIGGLTVSGLNNTNNVPKICGVNDGQHIHLNFLDDNPIKINFEETGDTDNWYMTVTQIGCLDDVNRAPVECLQYYPDTVGSVKSFNYRSLQSIAEPPVTYQLADQDYYVCLGQRDIAYSEIAWTKGDQTTNYYLVISSNVDIYTLDPSIVGTITVAAFDSQCTTSSLSYDYIEIISGTYDDADGVSTISDLFCGAGFPTFVSSTAQPFRLRFVSNGYENTREGSIGFYLTYILNT